MLDAHSLPAFVRELQSVILLGNIGVSIFFVLSGALLSYPFWNHWLSGKEPPSLRGYAVKRFARIAPGFYLSMTVSFVLSVTLFGDALNAQLLTRFLAGITFLNSFHWLTFFPVDVNGPLWSIGFEVFAYVLLVPFMLGMFRLIGTRRILAGMAYWSCIAVLCAGMNLVIVHNFIPSNVGRGWQYGMVGGAKSWMPWYNPIGMFNHFLLGIVAAGFLCYLQRMRVASRWRFDAVLMAVWIAIGAYLVSYRNAYTGFNGALGNIYFWPWFPLAIAISLCLLPFTRIMGDALDNRLLRYVAKISFGLYIWHALIIALLHVTLFPDFYYMGTKTLSAWCVPALMSLMISAVVASLSYKYIEHPALIWGHRQGQKLSQSSVAGPTPGPLGKAVTSLG